MVKSYEDVEREALMPRFRDVYPHHKALTHLCQETRQPKDVSPPVTRDELMAAYGWQFRAGRGIDGCVPDRWLPILAELFAAVEAAVPPSERTAFYWLDLKEKHGELAVDYVVPASAETEIEEAVGKATSNSPL